MNEIIKFLIASSALSTITVFVAKHFISLFFARDFEKFKSELEKESMRERVRYERLHAERANIIKEIYGKIIKVQDDFESLMSPIQSAGEPTKDEKIKNAVASANDFLGFFKENRIFFEEPLAERLDLLQKQLLKCWNDFKYKDELPSMQEKYAEWGKAWNTMKLEIPKLKKVIETDFREILGIRTK